jgi:D-ribose pyranose/furanose isomerase RbsD
MGIKKQHPGYWNSAERKEAMNASKLELLSITLVLFFIAGTLPRPAAPNPATPDWQATLQQRLPLYGHRNWIVVSDAAFPAYSETGIETIVVDQDLASVLHYVAKAIASSKHVRAAAFVDQELQFVPEQSYPGVTHLREQIKGEFNKNNLSSVPHSEAISKIDEAGKTFRVLFIKTNTTIPYTSVFMRLDCGYMTDEIDAKIKSAMAATSK